MKRTLTAIGLAALLTACHKQTAPEPQITAVRTVAAELAAPSNEVRYSATIAPDTQAELAFRVGGLIDHIATTRDVTGHVRELQEGDFVGAGTVLARLRPTEYQTRVQYAQAVSADAAASLAALHAQLNEAEASLAQATSDFERARTLFAEKALTRADFDAAEARRNTSVARRDAMAAQITAQQARIEGAAAQQKDASVTLGDTTLRAPFPGVIVSKRVARGSLAGAGTPAFVIADTRIARVTFGVPDLALSGFKPGDALPVLLEALPDREFQGRVTEIAPAADQASRVFTVELAVPNTAQLLKVGMVASVVVNGSNRAEPMPSIPLAAVVRAPSGYGVYTIENRNGADHVALKPVSLGKVNGNAVLITSGLMAGQRVVATAGLQLADGERVKQIP